MAKRKNKRIPEAKTVSGSSSKHDDETNVEEEPEIPAIRAVESDEDVDDGNSDNSASVYDSEDGLQDDDHSDEDNDEEASAGDSDDNDTEDEDSDDGFEDQGSSDDDDELLTNQEQETDSDDDMIVKYEKTPRQWSATRSKRKQQQVNAAGVSATLNNEEAGAAIVDAIGTTTSPVADPKQTPRWMHTDDLSSDDEDEDADGTGNRIGRVPLHWYDEYDHIGYDAHGRKVNKSATGSEAGDRIDQALALQENRSNGKFVVHDALNDRQVELTPRQLELIRRVQAGAYAHPEHDAEPEYIDYFSGVDPEISGLRSNTDEPKARFLPSKWEKMQVDKLLQKLREGKINMDYLTGKIRDMRDAKNKNGDPNQPFLLWTGDEEDELSLRKGPQHISAPKLPPPGHAASYRPPDEYLPTDQDLEQWKDTEAKDRPLGLMIPKKFPNLRSVGAYQHSVREAFERCLDLYLCPRVFKRRLNIDPESLVPQLPKASDLKPFPTAKCMEYNTPHDAEDNNNEPLMIRCISPSPDGQYLASGATDGMVRLWEVETGRLLRTWDLRCLIQDPCDMSENSNKDKSENRPHTESANVADHNDSVKAEKNEACKPVVCLEWNPNRSHHCLLAAAGKCVVVIATGTAGRNDAEVTEALLSAATRGGNVAISSRAARVVTWIAVKEQEVKGEDNGKSNRIPISDNDTPCGPMAVLRMTKDVSSVRWQAKGDYFVTVSPKAGAPAVLIHQLSKGNSQQPFGKAKGEAQLACFHPNKPFLFVASPQHVRVYHLVQQQMAKRLISGCRWIAAMDIHPSGDHLIVSSLDRRVTWFDLDLSTTPYKTLKFHERAVRACRFHRRYPLLASASDDGAVHIFHSMVYSDLMRNPLIVPVKILRGHAIVNKYGVLGVAFHPTQPWIFTCGADGKIFLYQDI